MTAAKTQFVPETKEPTMYKFRAEVVKDAFGFLTAVAETGQGLMNVRVEPLNFFGETTGHMENGIFVEDKFPVVPDVLASFGTYASRDTLKCILEAGEDWHVMAETIAVEPEYTGIRAANTFDPPPQRERTEEEILASIRSRRD
jgi:hypothetical protein